MSIETGGTTKEYLHCLAQIIIKKKCSEFTRQTNKFLASTSSKGIDHMIQISTSIRFFFFFLVEKNNINKLDP